MSNNVDFYEKASDILDSISRNQVKLVHSKTIHITYELYVYSLVIKAIHNSFIDSKNIKITHFDLKNLFNNSTLFRPKLAPGRSNQFSYIEFEKNKKIYEVHLDSMYPGRSRVEHEVDISIIEPNFNNKMLYASIECKHRAKNLSFNYAREFIGTMSDYYQYRKYTGNRKSFLVTNSKDKSHIKIENFIEKRICVNTAPRHSFFIDSLDNTLKEKEFIDLITKQIL